MLPQRFLGLPDGFDLAILAKERSGVAVFDVLKGTASINDALRPELRTAASYRAWLLSEAEAHGIPIDGIAHALMSVTFEVTGIEVKESFGHVSHNATFTFDCTSELRTDEKSYCCRSSGSKVWGYGHYWEHLFGTPGRGR
jgi:hypothetical protein